MCVDGGGTGGALVVLLRVERQHGRSSPSIEVCLNKLTARVRMVLMARVSILS